MDRHGPAALAMTDLLSISLTQSLGIAAAVVGLSTYLHTKEKAFKIQAGCSSWIWGLHFGLLGSHSAALMQFAIGTRSWCSTGTRTAKYQHGLFWM
jgi:Bacterial inner membrane protein